MEQNATRTRINAKAMGLEGDEIRHDEMVARLRRIRSALTVAELNRMFTLREEDEFFFAVGYYFLTPQERTGPHVRQSGVFRGYLALKYLDAEVVPEDVSPFERYRADVAGDIDEFCSQFRVMMRFRICHRCFEPKPLHAFRLSASTVCSTCHRA